MHDEKALSTFFSEYMKRNPIFMDKSALKSSYTPDAIQHRDEQIHQVAQILAPCLRFEKPSNLFIYGKTGTGKTLTTKYIMRQILDIAKQNNIPLKMMYINCKLKRVADTEYRLIAQLARDCNLEIPPTGLPTDEVYKLFYAHVDKEKMLLVIILDEIDQLVKKIGDEILYNLTRINDELKNAQITFIGISNDLLFIEHLDARVKSSLSEEEVVFPPYNALQLQSILRERASRAFVADVIGEGVIEKCAAFSAREHGDARRALELMRVAGELAERKGHVKIELHHIDLAQEKIERDWIQETVLMQPKQFQTTLYAILTLYQTRKDTLFTGEIYDLYRKLCRQVSLAPLTQRRISDVIAELDMLGIINAKVISKGRYGRTREITLAAADATLQGMQSLLEDALNLK